MRPANREATASSIVRDGGPSLTHASLGAALRASRFAPQVCRTQLFLFSRVRIPIGTRKNLAGERDSYRSRATCFYSMARTEPAASIYRVASDRLGHSCAPERHEIPPLFPPMHQKLLSRPKSESAAHAMKGTEPRFAAHASSFDLFLLLNDSSGAHRSIGRIFRDTPG